MTEHIHTRVVRREDDEWPTYLDELGSHPTPLELFARGEPIRSGERAVAVVGTRRPTASGVHATRTLTRGLAEAGFAIVSGVAVGIDAVAHAAALEAGGYTLAVLGCGLDYPYPRENLRLRSRILEVGTVVSEYPDDTAPLPAYFPARNRIIAGLCAATVVVEGGHKSGALITARIALDANRSVFAVPGSVRNPMAAAPNELIRTSQASLVTHFKHITDDLCPRPRLGYLGRRQTPYQTRCPRRRRAHGPRSAGGDASACGLHLQRDGSQLGRGRARPVAPRGP
jgi:DNA processing protein